jgi:hypothetical protein
MERRVADIVDARRSSSIVVDRHRSSSTGVGAGDPPDVIGVESLSSAGCTGSARRLHSGDDVRPLKAENDRKSKVMNNNDNKPETEAQTETETKTGVKPKVRIVDLEEVREVLGAAASAQGIAAAPKDTIMCSW